MSGSQTFENSYDQIIHQGDFQTELPDLTLDVPWLEEKLKQFFNWLDHYFNFSKMSHDQSSPDWLAEFLHYFIKNLDHLIGFIIILFGVYWLVRWIRHQKMVTKGGLHLTDEQIALLPNSVIEDHLRSIVIQNHFDVAFRLRWKLLLKKAHLQLNLTPNEYIESHHALDSEFKKTTQEAYQFMFNYKQALKTDFDQFNQILSKQEEVKAE